jgi:flagellar basal-body rod protein FlgB
MGSTPLLQVLQGFLQVTADRQQLVTSNMANVDTPGYRTKDVNFQTAMQQVMDQGQLRTQPSNMTVDNLPERPDGNNVNIDRESMMMSQTQLQYQMGVQLIKEQFHELLTAIKD